MISGGIPALTSQLNSLTRADAPDASSGGFSNLLQSALSSVDGLQSNADTKIGSMLQGASGADLGTTMISVEKADVAFQLMLQVRNKAVSAYQDLEKMQF